MSFYLQVLSTDSIDSSACIAVFTESHRFLFNCGEGIQRLCVEHKVRLSKIRAVMFSDFSPHNVFGLPGLSLTAADAGNNNIRVAGPPLLKSFLHTTRHFMKLPDGLLNFHSSAEKSSCIFNSSEVDLRMICFETGSSATQHNCFVGRTPELKGKFDLQKAQALKVPKGPLFGKLKNGQSITLADGTVISPEQVLGESELCKYFVVVCSVLPHEEELLKQITHNAELNRFQAGQVDTQTGGDLKCMVHLSPAATVNTALYQNWINSFGSSVTHLFTGAGTSFTTHSSFVATTTTCNKMHLTTPDLFPTMHNVYTGLYNAGDGNNNSSNSSEQGPSTNHVAAVPLLKFHLLPVRNQGVEFPPIIDCSALAKALYQEVTHESAENATLVKTALTQMEVVKGVLTKHIANATTSSTTTANSTTSSTTTANSTTAMDMDTCTAAIDTPINATVSESIERLYGVYTTAASQLLQSGVDGLISFLGTGCSIPSKYRNVSGILLQINNSSDSNSDSSRNISGGVNGDCEVRSLLIDAGEGTWAQMQRIAYESTIKTYNTTITGTNTLPTLHSVKYTLSSQLRVIWVSHPHADHHLGLVRVIMERKTSLFTHNATNSTHSNISDINSEPSVIVEPVVVIAPPSVLAFLHEYSLLNPFMQDAYIGVSCRAYDPDDSCVYTDCYWNKSLVGGTDIDSGGSGGGKDKAEETEKQEHKRKRTHSPDKHTPVSNNTILPTNSPTSTTTAEENIAITASVERSTVSMKPDDLPHKKHTHGDSGNTNHPKKTTKGFQYFIDTGGAATEDTMSVISTTTAAVASTGGDMISDMLTDTTNSTICGMNEINTIISATTTTTATSTAAASGKTWRNFKHIFKEKIPSEVLSLAAVAKDKADKVLHKMGIVELKNVQVVHCGQSYGLSVTIVPTSGSIADTTTATLDANDIMVDDNTAATTTVPTSTTFATTASTTTTATTASTATTATKAFKLVYSGDTRPCPRLIEIGTDATVVIHEATFEDTKQEEAIMKRHSTMSEAHQVGVEMNAFRTIFTHFSQRYPGVPLLAKYAPVVTPLEHSESNTDNSSDVADNMLVTTADDTVKDTTLAAAEVVDPILAFDYMQLSFANLLWAPASTAVFSAAFPGKTTISKGGEADEE